MGRVSLPIPGSHMVNNALGAIAVGLELGVTPEEATSSLESFPGIARRSQVLCETKSVVVIDDYAHHPTEIAHTLTALKRGWIPHLQGTAGKDAPGRLIVLFQPHRFSRTQELFADFVAAFGDADEVIVGAIHAAGEEPIEGVSGEALARSIQHHNVSYVEDFKDAFEGLLSSLQPGDVVAALGAGSITAVAHEFAELVKEKL